MKITVDLVKKLRERTSAGILNCKEALIATNGDIEKSILWLRDKGIATATKKNNRVASEGIVNIVVKKNIGTIYEVNSETDFVAKNMKFLDIINLIGSLLIENSKIKNISDILELPIKNQNNQKLNDFIISSMAVIGEKITFRRFLTFELNKNQSFGTYIHNNKIASIIIFNGKSNLEIGKQIAMHVSAMAPKFISSKDVPEKYIQNERNILMKKSLKEGKPKNIVEKMVEGRLKKLLSEICLLDQNFVIDPNIKISQLLKKNNLEIVEMQRFELGEGIEKITTDFATEVMKQVRK